MSQQFYEELEARRAAMKLDGNGEGLAPARLITARERLTRLLDGETFQEFAPFLERRTEEELCSGDGVVAGFGKIESRRVAVFAQDGTTPGGGLSEMGATKIAQVIERARAGGLPVVGLYDSTGLCPDEGAYGLAGPAGLLWQQTQTSGLTPQIAVVTGSAVGALALSVGLADFVIVVAETGHVSLDSGVTSARQEIDLIHWVVTNDAGALALTRRLLSYLPTNNLESPPYVTPADDPWRMDATLDTVVPKDLRLPYDMYAVLEAVFDMSSFLEVQAGFAPNVIVGLARMHGAVVGIVAQQPMMLAGILDIDASDKIARFVRTCDVFNIPVVTFVDSPGFLPGVAQEHGGIIRHGAKIVYAYSEATVPKISIITRKAYGGAYIVMSSKYIRTDFCFAWPSAEIAVLGAEGAVNILFRKQLRQSADPEAERARLVAEFTEKFSSPFRPAASGHIDDVIKPSETRPRLIAALEALKDKRVTGPRKKHGNMPM